MAATSSALSRDMQALFGDGTAVGLTDRHLLERVAGRGEGPAEAAFEALVRRHGPMVWRVCRGALSDPNDAQDAFQATFLVLMRRIGSLRGLESLGGWLYGVACRVAARARVEAARRRAVEGRAALRVVEAVEPADAGLDEFGPIVQEEVGRLPEKYRAVVVLCYWQGLTQEQAAAQLGCPLGTVRSRLARARDLLHRRLTRRGVVPMAGLAASGLDPGSAAPIPAIVPEAWVAATVRAAFPVAASGGGAQSVAASATVAVLVEEVLRSLGMTKLKTTLTGLALVAMGTAGAILAAAQVGPDRKAPGPANRPRAEMKAVPKPAAGDRGGAKKEPSLRPLKDYVVEPPDMLLVEVLEALPGRPISGERLIRPDGRISLGFYGDVDVAGLTLPEVKERIVLHLRKYISDEVLGLVEREMETGDLARDVAGRVIVRNPRETDRVFVDVTASNSKNYYIQGAVLVPGRLPITGHENVLDAINYAGGLTPQADHDHVVLYRKDKDGVLQRLPIDIDQITMGDDPTTNYQLQPGDRLVIPTRPGAGAAEDSGESEPADQPGRPARKVGVLPAGPRAPGAHDQPREEEVVRPRRAGAGDGPAIRDLERRLSAVEKKLDRILEALGRREGR